MQGDTWFYAGGYLVFDGGHLGRSTFFIHPIIPSGLYPPGLSIDGELFA